MEFIEDITDDLEALQEQLEAVLESKHVPTRSELKEFLVLVKRVAGGVGNIAVPVEDYVYDESMVMEDDSSSSDDSASDSSSEEEGVSTDGGSDSGDSI